jgi:hypothetical protein
MEKNNLIILLVSLVPLVVLAYALIALLGSYDLEDPVPLAERDLHDGTGKIDMVVTWAGSPSEERTTARRKAFSLFEGATNADEYNKDSAPRRVDDNGELWILLQRAYLFGGSWLGNVHVICPDGTELPEVVLLNFLGKSGYAHFRAFIILCPESAIFPKNHLPVFNSHAFEANLDQIPGLTERFVYACDDMWLNRRLPRNAFFDLCGRPRPLMNKRTMPCLRYAYQHCPIYAIYHQAMHNSATMVRRVFPNHQYLSPDHQMHPVTRSGFANARKLFPIDFKRVSQSSFRCESDFHPVSLVQNLLAASGLSTFRNPAVHGCLLSIYGSVWVTRICRNIAVIRGKVRSMPLLCVNDERNLKTGWDRRWLEYHFAHLII